MKPLLSIGIAALGDAPRTSIRVEAVWFAIDPCSVDLHPQRPQGTAVCVGNNIRMMKRYLNIKCLKECWLKGLQQVIPRFSKVFRVYRIEDRCLLGKVC